MRRRHPRTCHLPKEVPSISAAADASARVARWSRSHSREQRPRERKVQGRRPRPASHPCRTGSRRFLHFDVRSDNLCLREGRAVLVDWNNACVGNALLDIASWLPSLEAEGGPAPRVILPDETPALPAIASLLAGYFCARAGLPAIPQAPHARPLQLMQSKTALPWAARSLDLPPPA
ncbi:MAG: phosphotransferase [Actinomycetota bacterium]|nr:phosphotransferase [Actinomycetota bacterium]